MQQTPPAVLVTSAGHPHDPLLTVPEAAQFLGMGVDWVYAQIRRGRLPAVRLGRYVRLRTSSLEKWIEEHER